MSKFIDISKLQEFSIVEFLARLGFHAVRKFGKEHFYHSMLRETKKQTPSFTVWDGGNRWIDRGAAGISGFNGGGIVQLGQALWPDLSFIEVLNKIQEVCDLSTDLIHGYVPPERNTEKPQGTSHSFELVDTKPICTNYVLTKYLKSRGIIETSKGRLSEIYYRQNKSPQDKNIFYAIGWKNEHNSWEFTNAKGFKSSIGPKGVSYVPGSPVHTIIFEGYMDYLSWLTEHQPEIKPTVVVLNSIAMLNRAIDKVGPFPRIELYLDRDEPGINATKEFIKRVPQAKDHSHEYEGFKDYNEKIKAQIFRDKSMLTDFQQPPQNQRQVRR